MMWVLGLLGVYVAILLLVAWISVRPVRTPIFISPGMLGVPQEETTINTCDGIPLRAWWIPHESPTCVVVLLHGYLMTRSEMAPVAAQLHGDGCACLLPDLRAHGRSGGKWCGLGWFERFDALAAAEEAARRYPGIPIVLMGSSMGAVASAFAAAESDNVSGIVLDCAYSKLPSAVRGWWRFVGGEMLSIALAPTLLAAWPLVRINPFKIDVAAALAKSTAPVLLLHGEKDRLALPSEAERNLAAVGDRGRLVWLPDSNHAEGRWIHPELYMGELRSFLQAHGLILA